MEWEAGAEAEAEAEERGWLAPLGAGGQFGQRPGGCQSWELAAQEPTAEQVQRFQQRHRRRQRPAHPDLSYLVGSRAGPRSRSRAGWRPSQAVRPGWARRRPMGQQRWRRPPLDDMSIDAMLYNELVSQELLSGKGAPMGSFLARSRLAS
jgi:hypothetical protein